MNLSIHIPQFEGPLGLLLYLIRKEEMDIFDIDVQLITSQYLEYIKKMKQFDLEVAGDFIAMAATLIQIKSKMLLPNYNEEGEEDEVEDPRKELVERLIEYQKFQEASKKLYERPLLGRDVYRRGKGRNFHSDEEGEIILDEGGLFSLIAHYRNSVRKMKKAIHKVARKTRSIAGRIMEMKEKFVVGQRVLMRDLLTSVEEAKEELLITFLSCLEMGKMGLVSVYQAEVYGDIYLTAKREITLESVERVEEYDSGASEQTADRLMEEAQEEAFEKAEQMVASAEDDDNSDELSEENSEDGESFDMASDDDILKAEEELDIKEESPFQASHDESLQALRNSSEMENESGPEDVTEASVKEQALEVASQEEAQEVEDLTPSQDEEGPGSEPETVSLQESVSAEELALSEPSEENTSAQELNDNEDHADKGTIS